MPLKLSQWLFSQGQPGSRYSVLAPLRWQPNTSGLPRHDRWANPAVMGAFLVQAQSPASPGAAQMESGIVFGLSAALHGEITLKAGRVEQSNFPDYDMVRMADCPAIEVEIVESGWEHLGRVGEPGTPPIAPAVANAVFAATGNRVRRLPIRLA